MCYVFNEFAYTERKKMKLPSPEQYFYFIFFFITEHTINEVGISLSLSLNHCFSLSMTIIRRKKNRKDTFITPLDTAVGKRPFLFYYYYIHFFFIPRTPATIAIIQIPFCIFAASARSSPRIIVFWTPFCWSGTLYYINIIYIL